MPCQPILKKPRVSPLQTWIKPIHFPIIQQLSSLENTTSAFGNSAPLRSEAKNLDNGQSCLEVFVFSNNSSLEKAKKTTWSQQLGFMLVLASSFCLTNWHDISNLEKTTVNVCKCDLIFNLSLLLLADWHLSFLLKGLENNHCISPHPVQWSIFPS